MKEKYELNGFTITKREIIASIAIIAVMLIIGGVISGKITESQMDQNEAYYKAVKINQDSDLFVHGMATNVGNAFVYGDLEAVDTVTLPEVEGHFMTLKKVEEHYTMHTEEVTYTREVNGKTESYTEVESYWTWDEYRRWEYNSEQVTFLGVPFAFELIGTPEEEELAIMQQSEDVRYVYYSSPTSQIGTLYAKLGDDTIQNGVFYNKPLEEAVEYAVEAYGEVVFWIVWLFVIAMCVYGFYYLDNKWLES